MTKIKTIIFSVGMSLFLGIIIYNTAKKEIVDPIKLSSLKAQDASDNHKTYLWVEGLSDAEFFATVRNLPSPMNRVQSRSELYYYLFDSLYYSKR